MAPIELKNAKRNDDKQCASFVLVLIRSYLRDVVLLPQRKGRHGQSRHNELHKQALLQTRVKATFGSEFMVQGVD